MASRRRRGRRWRRRRRCSRGFRRRRRRGTGRRGGFQCCTVAICERRERGNQKTQLVSEKFRFLSLIG
ncbi:unnamed protein product [Linum tenue]|uniref:Uncharacterized protein n=1 Tax=Linum tenue TaxID=586396 RepID=A0AAV0GTT6_9ROSI|nr:unnamed protein product [Linum tenue]